MRKVICLPLLAMMSIGAASRTAPPRVTYEAYAIRFGVLLLHFRCPVSWRGPTRTAVFASDNAYLYENPEKHAPIAQTDGIVRIR